VRRRVDVVDLRRGLRDRARRGAGGREHPELAVRGSCAGVREATRHARRADQGIISIAAFVVAALALVLADAFTRDS
jgi:hypothetical protein